MTIYLVQSRDRIIVKGADFCLLMEMWESSLVKV